MTSGRAAGCLPQASAAAEWARNRKDLLAATEKVLAPLIACL